MAADTTRTSKRPDPIDKHVGSRVRMRRLLLGMSQNKLGVGLGISFQQIQKYEKGDNRIGASRLQGMANILGVPVAHFFDEAPDSEATAATDGGNNPIADALATPDGVRLVHAYSEIQSPVVRRRVVSLVEAMTAEELQAAE